jgi:hypothetical protein
MSQRMAFLFSIVLMLVLAVGVVVSRDQLFPVRDAQSNAMVTSTPTTAGTTSLQTESTMKVVDIIEPTPTPGPATGSGIDLNTDSQDDHHDLENNHKDGNDD